MIACWNFKSSCRPTFEQILKKLRILDLAGKSLKYERANSRGSRHDEHPNKFYAKIPKPEHEETVNSVYDTLQFI